MRILPILPLLLATSLAACVPVRTNTVYVTGDIGREARIEYGVIVSMRDVQVQGRPTGVGTLAGGAAGAVAGSLIGGGARAHVLGAVGGAIIGGLAGSAIEQGASVGYAVEFIIREDSGQTISVVQTNEEDFQPGERVLLTRGARTRLSRVAPGY